MGAAHASPRNLKHFENKKYLKLRTYQSSQKCDERGAGFQWQSQVEPYLESDMSERSLLTLKRPKRFRSMFSASAEKDHHECFALHAGSPGCPSATVPVWMLGFGVSFLLSQQGLQPQEISSSAVGSMDTALMRCFWACDDR